MISPLLSLIKDQKDFLTSKNIDAVSIDSTLSYQQEKDIMSGLRSGRHKILMIAVERFKNERFRNFIKDIPISLLVVDEAHCISEWGHNFRPDYLKIPAYKTEFHIPQVLLLTATANPEVINDMCSKFSIPGEDVTVTGFYRKNLDLSVKYVPSEEKRQQLLNMLKNAAGTSSIVYVTQQKTADDLAAFLKSGNINAEAYHAGMDTEDRINVQNRFMSGQTDCITATIAFGMGIDKKNVRRVIHFNIPKSIENYSQEIGRAGRDGERSECSVLADLNDLNVLENFIYGDTPEKRGIMYLLESIPRNEKNWEIRAKKLSDSSGIRPLPLKTLLVHLEMKEIIKPVYSYLAQYRFSNIKTEKEILQSFSGERRSFLQNLFNASDKKRVWTTVDIEAVQEQTGSNRERIVKALEYLHQESFIKLEGSDNVEVFEILNTDFSTESVANEIYDFFVEREKLEISRIEKMLNLFQSADCLSRSLAEYFGEKLKFKNCGHCSTCRSGPVKIERSHELAPLSSFNFEELSSALAEKLKHKNSPALTAKFLCGITAPYLTQARAKNLRGFAALENYRYPDVKKWVASQMIQKET